MTPLERFNLQWATFDCTLRFLEPAFFDEFIGNVLRSALGYALRDIADSQSYRYLWTPSYSNRRLKAGGYSDNPRPFVLRIHDGWQTWYAEGGTLRFRFTLIGKGIDYLAYFIAALLRIGERGLGLKRSRCALQSLESVLLNGERIEIYCEGDSGYSTQFRRIQLAELPHTPPSPRITLLFRTPVHLRAFGHLVTPDTFTMEILLRRTIERIRSLGHLHDRQAWFDLDDSLWETPIQIQSQSLHFQEWELWLSRRHHPFGGLVGQVKLEVDDTFPFYPALLAMQWIGVGKKTTYGFGSVDVHPGEAGMTHRNE